MPNILLSSYRCLRYAIHGVGLKMPKTQLLDRFYCIYEVPKVGILILYTLFNHGKGQVGLSLCCCPVDLASHPLQLGCLLLVQRLCLRTRPHQLLFLQGLDVVALVNRDPLASLLQVQPRVGEVILLYQAYSEDTLYLLSYLLLKLLVPTVDEVVLPDQHYALQLVVLVVPEEETGVKSGLTTPEVDNGSLHPLEPLPASVV